VIGMAAGVIVGDLDLARACIDPDYLRRVRAFLVFADPPTGRWHPWREGGVVKRRLRPLASEAAVV
jgi:hypothetical protein